MAVARLEPESKTMLPEMIRPRKVFEFSIGPDNTFTQSEFNEVDASISSDVNFAMPKELQRMPRGQRHSGKNCSGVARFLLHN
jgi:hypothetical protein